MPRRTDWLHGPLDRLAPVPRSAAPTAVPVDGRQVLHPFATAAAWPCHGHSGRAMWQMRFEGQPLPHSGSTDYRVRIWGVPGSAVRWVRLRQPHRVLFEMDTREVGHGHLSTAGEIIEAMAVMSGHHGMLIDCGRSMPASPDRPTTLDMLLHLPHAEHTQQVRVQAELHD